MSTLARAGVGGSTAGDCAVVVDQRLRRLATERLSIVPAEARSDSSRRRLGAGIAVRGLVEFRARLALVIGERSPDAADRCRARPGSIGSSAGGQFVVTKVDARRTSSRASSSSSTKSKEYSSSSLGSVSSSPNRMLRSPWIRRSRDPRKYRRSLRLWIPTLSGNRAVFPSVSPSILAVSPRRLADGNREKKMKTTPNSGGLGGLKAPIANIAYFSLRGDVGRAECWRGASPGRAR